MANISDPLVKQVVNIGFISLMVEDNFENTTLVITRHSPIMHQTHTFYRNDYFVAKQKLLELGIEKFVDRLIELGYFKIKRVL